jgi:hypothetical protein
MSEHDLRLLIEASSQACEEWFKEKGSVPPTWLAIDDKGAKHIIPAVCPDKDINAALVRAAFDLLNIKRYVFMDEAWILDRRQEDWSGKTVEEAKAEIASFRQRGIADHPERVEIVMFSAEDHEAGQIMAHRKIERPKGKRAYLGPLEIQDTRAMISEGRMVGMLPQRGTKQ